MGDFVSDPSTELPGPKPGRYWGGDDFDRLREAANDLRDEAVAVRGDVDDLRDDVTALQAAVPATPRLLPVGTVLSFAGSAAPPTGFLLCDGSAVSRTTYADLFAVIGTTYGAGNGSTTFNLPDLRGRTIVGVGQGPGLTNRLLNASGGAETHTLTTSEMPSHQHGGTVTGEQLTRHYSTVTSGNTQFGIGNYRVGWAGYSEGDTSTGGWHTHSIQPEGGNAAHNNMQPFRALNFIIAT